MMVLNTTDTLNGNLLGGPNANNTAPCGSRTTVPPSLDMTNANCQQLLVQANRRSSANNNDSPIEEESDTHICDSDSSPPCISPGPSCLWLRAAVLEIYPMDDFDRVEYLGEGFFSDVYKVLQKSTRQTMVLKIGKDRSYASRSSFDSPKTIDLFTSRHRQKSNVLREVELMKKLRHPNVLGYRGVCVDSNQTCWNLHMLIDYCDCGSLSRLILDLEDPFRWRQRCSLALDLAKGMEYVHGQGYVHRDLTSMNVLLKKTGAMTVRAVVADFGLACAIPQGTDPALIQVGTPYWMAPECLREEWYNEKADVFSFGVIVCQMIARIDADPDAGLYRTPVFGIDYVRFSVHCPPDTPTALLRLAFTCCLMNPQSRPSFAKVAEQMALLLRSIEPNGRRRSTRTSLLNHRDALKNETRIGRSLSDAALRSTNMRPVCRRIEGRANQSLASAVAEDGDIDVVIVNGDIESVALNDDGEPGSSWQQLAQSVADGDPGYEPSDANPFAEHAKFRSGRKIPPPTTTTPGRHRPPHLGSSSIRMPSIDNPLWTSFDLSSPDGISASDDPPTAGFSGKRLKNPKYSSTPLKDLAMGLPRRCSSLPSSPVSRRKGSGGGAALATSVHGGDLAELLLGPPAPRHEAQGRLTFTFRDVDMKFASLRYPVRRHTEVLMVSPSSSGTETDSYAAASTSSPQSLISDEKMQMVVVEEDESDHRFPLKETEMDPIELRLSDDTDTDDSSPSSHSSQNNSSVVEFPPPLPPKRLDDDSLEEKLATVVKFGGDNAGSVLCAGQNPKRCCIL